MGGRARTTPGGDCRRERRGPAGVRTARRPKATPAASCRSRRGPPCARVRRPPPSLRAARRARRRACRAHGRCSGMLDGHPHQRVRIDGRRDAAGADRPDERSHQHDRHLAARGIAVRRPHRSVLVAGCGRCAARSIPRSPRVSTSATGDRTTRRPPRSVRSASSVATSSACRPCSRRSPRGPRGSRCSGRPSSRTVPRASVAAQPRRGARSRPRLGRPRRLAPRRAPRAPELAAQFGSLSSMRLPDGSRTNA